MPLATAASPPPGREILIVTGRDEWARGLTSQWLSQHLPVPIGGLYMRRNGDYRCNTDVKRAIHTRLALTYDIRAAIDDDPLIVDMWQGLGIPVTMVLEGDDEFGLLNMTTGAVVAVAKSVQKQRLSTRAIGRVAHEVVASED